MTSANNLVEFWQDCPLDTAPYIHPQDRHMLDGKGAKHFVTDRLDFNSYVESKYFGDDSDSRFHLSLLPIPYGGNLATAEIVILLLNPGTSHADFYSETHRPELRERLRANIRQSFIGVDFPFLWLDPQFCWDAGFIWWERKLRRVIRRIADKKFDGNYRYALRDLSRRLAHIELVPYRSVRSNSNEPIASLQSSLVAQDFVRSVLVPKAKAGDLTLIVTRRAADWGLQAQGRNIVVYDRHHSRGASLSPDSDGGKAILEKYKHNN